MAQITRSVVGPYVSIHDKCCLENIIVRNSILGDGVTVKNMILENSLLGLNVTLEGQAAHFDLGDQSWVKS